MEIKSFVLTFLSIICFSAHAVDDIKCSPSNKIKNKIDCEEGINGYIEENETIRGITLKYNSDGKQETLYLDSPISFKDLLSIKALNDLLQAKGIKNAKNISPTTFFIESDTPVFKDPENLILNYGCAFANSPVVISIPSSDSCNEYLCSSSVICKYGSKKISKDAICKASQTKEGVYCPKAKDCLDDKNVKIENYNAKKNSETNHNDTSKGISR